MALPPGSKKSSDTPDGPGKPDPQSVNELKNSFAPEFPGEFWEMDRFLLGDLAVNNGDFTLKSLRAEFQSGRNQQTPSVDDAWVRFTSQSGADSKPISESIRINRPAVASDIATEASVSRDENMHAKRSEGMHANRDSNTPSRMWSRSYFFAFTLAIFLAVGAFFKGSFWNRSEADFGKMEYVTAVGQQVTVRLDDGTVVKLAPDTRLRYTYDNIRSRRDVYLNGEAYFEVVADNKSPFTVFAGNTSTQVLGTSFGVRNYHGDSVTHVYVESGRVAFSGVGVLNAGDVASLTGSGKSTLVHSREIALFRSWTDGALTVQGERFEDVISRLERWYGISINVTDPSINNIHLTAVFRGKSMSNLVAVLAGALEARVQEEGSVLTLSSW